MINVTVDNRTPSRKFKF